MKSIVVCGDSFNIDDAEYPGIHWTSKLDNVKLTNLSIQGASNFVIRLQIDQAIKLDPDLIIISFTSSLRTVIKYNKQITTTLLDRIYRAGNNKNLFDLISFPYAGAELYNILDTYQLSVLKNYFTEFVDLDLLRYENYYLIKDALETLHQSKINFSYSLGGFDHKMFCKQSPFDFKKFKKYQTPINLWDHYTQQRTLRPWFHVVDADIQVQLTNYYKSIIDKDN
jgi:hypothetical protein